MTYLRPATVDARLRLHLNENTAGCSPAVLDAIRGVSREEISFYPDYGPTTAACERALGAAPGSVLLTNGLDEGLHLLACAAARRPGGHAIIPQPSFEMHGVSADAAGLAVVHIDPEPEFRFPLECILSAIAPSTRIIFLTDPNNPTGLGIPPGAIAEIVRATPDALVLVDEAYADFSGRTVLDLVPAHPNLVVGRTFAKAHGLAALRVGALVAQPQTLAALARMQPPFSVNLLAVRALNAALDDRAYVDWYVAQARASRERVTAFCARHGLHTWPSEANFVLLRIGDQASAVVQALAARGIAIRDRSSAPGCAGCVRITAGVLEHTEACLTALEEILASRQD